MLASTTDTSSLAPQIGSTSGAPLGEIAPNGQLQRPISHWLRPSPTPSLKKKKAEALVKHHGSPQHVRVTAGGRIVPSEQSPLTYPRYGYSAVKANGGVIKFAPNLHGGHEYRDYATQENFIAQDEHGNFCQIIDGIVKPIRIVDGNYQLERTAPNVVDQMGHRGMSWSTDRNHSHPDDTRDLGKPGFMVASEPPVASQIAALELEYSKLDGESKDLDKTEALCGKSMSKPALDALITKRRELVVGKDRIRVSLKHLRTQPIPNAPTSPRAMMRAQIVSSPRARPLLSAFPPQQDRRPVSNPQNGPLHPGPLPRYAGPFDPQSAPRSDTFFAHHLWPVPPLGKFMLPATFDGAMAPPYMPYVPPVMPAAAREHVSSEAQQNVPGQDRDYGQLRTLKDGNDPSSKSSRAVPIKLPLNNTNGKPKSGLNPMSPVYRPFHDDNSLPMLHDQRLTDVLPTTHRLPPASLGHDRAATKSDNTISPTKKATHLHSSSVSSFETADFFPRDTREYSTRQLAYPMRLEHSDDKENLLPDERSGIRDESPMTPPGQDYHDSNWNPVIPDKVFKNHATRDASLEVPAECRASRVSHSVGAPQQPLSTSRDLLQDSEVRTAASDAVVARGTHNVSPKVKREFMFVQEHPERFAALSSSPEVPTPPPAIVKHQPACTPMLDFSQKPREWIEGYQAGLQRRPVGRDRMGEFLDGYCSGLLKSSPSSNVVSSDAQQHCENESQSGTFDVESRPHSKPVLDTESAAKHTNLLETLVPSMDTLKEAVFAPQNEDAILSPAADGPHVDDQPPNLGAWAKAKVGPGHAFAGFPFPERASSIKQQNRRSEHHDQQPPSQQKSASTTDGDAAVHTGPVDALQTTASKVTLPVSGGASTNDHDHLTSLDDPDPQPSRPFTGRRIFSPQLDWNSASAATQVVGFAVGRASNMQLAAMQYDGPSQPVAKRVMSNETVATVTSRFHEGSLDGMSSPPLSPILPSSSMGSPQISPNRAAIHDKVRDGLSRTASKNVSPTKAKFEHIADKVGIKVATGSPTAGSSSQVVGSSSPTGKRRWRDVWRGSKPKDAI